MFRKAKRKTNEKVFVSLLHCKTGRATKRSPFILTMSQKMIENNWDQIVGFVYRMNKNQYILSSYKTLDPLYYIIEGTRK